MEGPSIEITLQGMGTSETAQRFSPGDVVQGSTRVTPEKDLDCRHLFARLQWRTEGRGDEDKQVVAEQDLYQGVLQGGVPRHHSFHFRLPDQPWSYAGKLVRIVWEVEVSIDVAWSRDPKASVPFVLRPTSS